MIFADGSILDTSDDNSVVDFIKKKFAIKNTSGYSLNAFLDFY